MEELNTQNHPAGLKRTIQFSFKRRITFSLTIFVILIFNTFIVGEVLVRIFTRPPLYIAHPVLGGTLRPNTTTVYTRGNLRQVVKINSFGFHDEKYPLEKPKNTKRVLILGDSYIEALQVPIEKTFAKLLQKNLNLNIDEFEVQTINTGRSARGVLEYYLTLRVIGWDFQPDLVLAAFYMNDVRNDLKVRSQIEFDEEGKPVRIKKAGVLPIPLSIKRILHHSHFYYFVMERSLILHRSIKELQRNKEIKAGETAEPIKDDHFDILRKNYTDNKYKAWDLTKETLEDMNKECFERGSKFMLMIIPWESQFDARKTAATEYWKLEKASEEPQRILKKLGKDAGFPVLDLLGYFRKIDDLPLHGDDDGHWNEKGNFYAAQAAADFVLKHRLLQKDN